MKKPSLDGESIKQFFVLHGEKLAVGAFALLGCLLIYSGLTRDGYPSDRQPDKLRDLAQQVKRSVDEGDHWEAVQEELPRIDDYPTNAQAAQRPIRDDAYAVGPFEVKQKSAVDRRADPELYPPEQIITVGVLGALAVRDAKATNPLASLEAAEEIEVETKPAPKRRRTRRGSAGGSGGGYGGGEYGEGSASPYGEGYAGGYGSGEGSGGEYGMPGGMAGGPNRRLNPKYDDGYRPGSVGGGGAGGYGYGQGSYGPGGSVEGSGGYGEAPGYAEGSAGSGYGAGPGSYGGDAGAGPMQATPANTVVPKTGWFIAGAAVYPHERLNDEYQRVLADATGFSPQRDRPTYLAFELQRADVTDRTVAELTDQDWSTISNSKSILDRADTWDGPVPDPVPRDYRDPGLTMPIAPLLVKDYRQFALHPAVPLQAPRPKRVQAPGAETPAETEEAEEAAPLESGVLDLTALNRQRQRQGGAGAGYGMAYGAEGSGAMGEGYPGGSGGGYGGSEMYGGSDMYGGMGGYGGGMGSGGYGGMGGMGGGYGGTAVLVPEYKLIRFYDFWDPRKNNSIKPGRKYAYRIRVAIEDPNYPGPSKPAPPLRLLSAEAIARVQKQMQDDKQAGRKTYYRWSDYSVPSAPAELPPVNRWVVGAVDPGSTSSMTVNGKPIELKRASDQGEIIAVNWDFTLATELAAPFTGVPGKVLDYQGTLDVIDPVTLQVKTLPDGDVKTGSVMLDVFGGTPLASESRDESLTVPGEVLVFDPQRGLVVLDETDHFREYRKYTFQDEKEAAQKKAEQAAAAPAAPGGGYGEGSGSPYGAGSGGY